MNRIICFLTALLAIVISAIGQTYDKTDDGTRIIQSDWQNLYTGFNNAAGFSLIVALDENSDVKAYTMCIKLNENEAMQFKVGRKLLLKFKDGNILELENIREIGPFDYTMGGIYGDNIYVMPTYRLSERDIQTILNGEVEKIRIENNTNYFDRKIKGKKFHERFLKLYEQIQDRMNTSNDIRQDF